MALILWKEAVTDRMQEDVDRVTYLTNKGWDGMTAGEQQEWLAGLKGSLNKTDIERIENNVQLMSDVLELGLTTYHGTIPEYPNESYFERLLNNLTAIRAAYCIHEDTPEVPEKPVNDYQKINDVEKILSDIHSILLNNFSYYCGNEIYAGDSTGLLL